MLILTSSFARYNNRQLNAVTQSGSPPKVQPAVNSQSQLSSMERDTSLRVSPCLNGTSACTTTSVSGKKRKTFVGADTSLAAFSQKSVFHVSISTSFSSPFLPFYSTIPLFPVSSPAIFDPAPNPWLSYLAAVSTEQAGLKGGSELCVCRGDGDGERSEEVGKAEEGEENC